MGIDGGDFIDSLPLSGLKESREIPDRVVRPDSRHLMFALAVRALLCDEL